MEGLGKNVGKVADSLGNDTKRPRSCNSSDADVSCGEFQRCMEEKNNERIEAVCKCIQGYEFADDDKCRPSLPQVPINAATVRPDQTVESGGGSSVAGLLIPTFLILIAVLLYFGARRYRWVQRFRQYRQNYGNVLVTRDDDDDDDPPIA
ncbi:hypothetical protein M0802_008234 [Mischocyttarus mexicanus]|nr:hypothetical protein M0802_008234 [Mischocyttarus mexicanus]